MSASMVLEKSCLLGHLPSMNRGGCFKETELLFERLVSGGIAIQAFCSVPRGTIDKFS